MADTRVTVTDDLAAIAYYAMNNDQLILSGLVKALPYFTDPTIRKILYLRSRLNIPKYDAEEGWRPLDEAVEQPKGSQGKFSKRWIDPKTAMKILKIAPQQFKQTFYADQVGPNAADLPKTFAPYFWLQQNRRGATEIARNTFMSVDPDSVPAFNAGSTYAVGDRVTFEVSAVIGDQFWECKTATSAGESPSSAAAKWTNVDNKCMAKGWGTIIKDEINDIPAANKLATGAHNKTNIGTHLKDMYRAIPDELKDDNEKFIAYMNISNGEAFNDFENDQFYKGVTTDESGSMVVRGTNKNLIVKPVYWMQNHPGIIMTKSQNLIFGTDLQPDFTSIGKMVHDLHGYRTIQKATLAFQIGDFEPLFIDDNGWTS